MKRTAKARKKKQSISGQRQQREKEGEGAETGAGVSNIPVSQSSHKRAAISLADYLKHECDFRNVKSYQIEACCHYEYFRESAAMRKTCVLATCTDEIARSTLTFVLNKVGWKDAAEKNEAPPPWNSLDAAIKDELSRCVRRCVKLKNKHPTRHRPLLVQEFSPGHDPFEIERQLEGWKEKAYYDASLDRDYFFGLFRLDETYNETKAVRAFRALFLKRRARANRDLSTHGKTKGGGGGWRLWQARLNDLVVMRLWKRFPKDPLKRAEHVAEFTTAGFKGCKDYWDGGRAVDRIIGKAANEEISKARAKALKFFQSLFPGERPLSWQELESS
jgi:hypothetical protein